jgi:hypothetical protein
MENASPFSVIDLVLWGGALVSLLGLAGIVWCILRVARAKRAGLADDEMKALLQRVLPVNLGALFLSVLGLMMVIVGISFG